MQDFIISSGFRLPSPGHGCASPNAFARSPPSSSPFAAASVVSWSTRSFAAARVSLILYPRCPAPAPSFLHLLFTRPDIVHKPCSVPIVTAPRASRQRTRLGAAYATTDFDGASRAKAIPHILSIIRRES